jgi:CheY-like chemotaxis protein
MSYAFDRRGFQDLLDESERLVARAVDQERRLASLVSQLDGDRALIEVAAVVREICVVAREQRLLSEGLLRRLGRDGNGFGRDEGIARILVVDDTPDNRDMAAEALEAAGYRAITADNGLEGVIVAHYARPAAVLMDITMPVLDGVSAARLLKASEATRHLNVIAYTARPEFDDGPLGRMFAAVLTKPASPDAIVEAIQRHTS